MALVEYACPNCGASIDASNGKTAYCEFCGTKLIDHSAVKTMDEYYEQALKDIEFEHYLSCKSTVYYGLRVNPNDSNLLLIKAVLDENADILKKVKIEDVSSEILHACKKAMGESRRTIDGAFREYYWDPKNMLDARGKYVDTMDKISIHEMEGLKDILNLAKFILSEEEYAEYESQLIDRNEKEAKLAQDHVDKNKMKYIVSNILGWCMLIVAFYMWLKGNLGEDGLTLSIILCAVGGLLVYNNIMWSKKWRNKLKR